MKMTTLCYLEKEGRVLLLHRTKKQNDENGGKYIGVGGKFEAGESPEDCMRREVWEETGYIPTAHRYRGIVTFVSDEWGTEYMHIFTCCDFTGEIKECDEGVLEWVDKKDVYDLPLWEGDKIFLKLIENPDYPFFSLRLEYNGDALISAILNDEVII